MQTRYDGNLLGNYEIKDDRDQEAERRKFQAFPLQRVSIQSVEAGTTSVKKSRWLDFLVKKEQAEEGQMVSDLERDRRIAIVKWRRIQKKQMIRRVAFEFISDEQSECCGYRHWLMQSTLSSDEYCQSATRSARSDREQGQFIRSKFDESDFENRQLAIDCQQRQSQAKQFGQFYQLIRSQSSELDLENRQLVRYGQNQEQQFRIIKQAQFLRSPSDKVVKQNGGRNYQLFISPNSIGSKSGMPIITSYGQEQVSQIIIYKIGNRVTRKSNDNLAQQFAPQYFTPILKRQDQAGRHEGRQLHPAGISSALKQTYG
ncbi:MAG: hypothetical protein EZS28_034537 [Streblomastix strix]|uniref:Uncharacterized protein n=1 Tax=Streblomastix strix TaxID=222440 RepID=A0A5J4UHP0_9EUKA|nr:MAG: hypothetical protein EZS28_034537 [Streblomastix strix]